MLPFVESPFGHVDLWHSFTLACSQVQEKERLMQLQLM